jgi:8-oxo-dGTP diphosphatase
MNDKRYCYEHPRPGLTVDVVLFRERAGELEVLVVERGREPYRGHLAFPGGYVDEMEPLDEAARRELREETGIEAPALRQIGAFGDPGRDPRGHTVSVAFAGRMDGNVEPQAADDAAAAKWIPLSRAEGLAFDHDQMLKAALSAFYPDRFRR